MSKKETPVAVVKKVEKEMTPHEKDEAERMKLMVAKAKREQHEK